jgi:exodeoxyribonuclease-3
MRIVTWNCNMAFYRKAAALEALKPDIAIIQECAKPEVLAMRGWDVPGPDQFLWMGDNPNKGLGVFAYGDYRLSLPDFSINARLRHILPVEVSGPVPFHLLGIWAQNLSGGISRKHQLGPLRRALTAYGSFLEAGPCVVSGDLNNSVYWDKPGWRINQAKALERLNCLDTISAYHHFRKCAQGDEPEPTLYWRDRKKDGPTYHIDFTFIPTAWKDAVTDCWIGSFEDWVGAGLSDHVPLVVDVDEGSVTPLP